jgi:hypothetical protein
MESLLLIVRFQAVMGKVMNSLGEKSTGMGTCDMMGFRDNTTLQ